MASLRKNMTGLALLLVLCFVSAASCARPNNVLVRPNELAISKHEVDAVNQDDSIPWTAGENEMFKGMTIEEARKYYLGTNLPTGEETEESRKRTYKNYLGLSDLPKNFDARQQWPGYIHAIRNQEQCGSCWAFAASEALSDRFTIASKGAVNVVLSPQDLLSCDTNDMGCNGGWVKNAWQYMEDYGIVSDACDPYYSGNGVNNVCPGEDKCMNKTASFHKYKVADFYQLDNVEDIQREIMINGPVEASFSVPKSFFSYMNGVYVPGPPSQDPIEGGHAIKVLGWGVYGEEETPYWLCANSWGTGWGGLDGFFMIKRGEDTCKIESDVWGGHPVV